MAGKKRRRQYDREDIREFLETIRSDIKKANRGGKVDIRDTCKAFKIGQSSAVRALVNEAFIEKSKGGIKRWKWIEREIKENDITDFIRSIQEYNKSLDKYKKEPAPEKSNAQEQKELFYNNEPGRIEVMPERPTLESIMNEIKIIKATVQDLLTYISIVDAGKDQKQG